MTQNTFLEVANGISALLCLCLLGWIIEHLRWELEHRRITWGMLTSLPSVAVVVSLMFYNLGVLLTRGVIWWWRLTTDGRVAYTSTQNSIFIIGSMLTATGLLWLIAILSKPRYGDWPWRACILLVSFYVTASIIYHVFIE